MKKKKNNYGCPECGIVNPDIVMVERWDTLQESPYSVEILIRKIEDKSEYYESTNIKLTKKMTNKTLAIATCGYCKNEVEHIPYQIAESLKKRKSKKRNKGMKGRKN